MAVLKKIKRAIRGEVKLTTVAREALRRSLASQQQKKERELVANGRSERATLLAPYSQMTAERLLDHFKGERATKFFSGFERRAVDFYNEEFSADALVLNSSAHRIVASHIWPLMGCIERNFGKRIQWTIDPLSLNQWPLDYHRDIKLIPIDGSDIRVLWELNRLGHFVTLARAYLATNDQRYSAEFFSQFKSWDDQNPYGRGPNWTCAMEVALRAINLLAVFEIFRHSPDLDGDSLERFLRIFQQHGNYIERNLEFSHIATSNHYLSDVVGLLWLGLALPEFHEAKRWQEFALQEMPREMEKQILDDGADFEASTGYHRFVLELFLYSFLLCRNNGVQIEQKYWTKLHQMLIYLRSYLRPDGLAPLIGDTDSGQVLPVRRRRADDHAYLLAIGAVVFNDAGLKLEGVDAPEELFCFLGEDGVKTFREMTASSVYDVSKGFPQAGTYVMRDRDLYLCFNASGVGINGRGSHGHNDALSIEVLARGRAFIVDPGTYVYSALLEWRHRFRSTAYHSTVKVDDIEQNTIDILTPFVIGNEAKPRVLEWVTGEDFDKVVAEHYGYSKLAWPVVHRRTVTFDKRGRCWLIDDEFLGDGDHIYEIRFHFSPDADVYVQGATVEARIEDVGLTVTLLDSTVEPTLEDQPVSRDYGEKSYSVSACWEISGRPGKLSWKIAVFDAE